MLEMNPEVLFVLLAGVALLIAFPTVRWWLFLVPTIAVGLIALLVSGDDDPNDDSWRERLHS